MINSAVEFICIYDKGLLPEGKDLVLDFCDKLASNAAIKYEFRKAQDFKYTRLKEYLRGTLDFELDSAVMEGHDLVHIEGPRTQVGGRKVTSFEAVVNLFDVKARGLPQNIYLTLQSPFVGEPVEDIFRWVVSNITCMYGVISAGDTQSYVGSEVTAMPSYRWSDRSEATRKWVDELHFYQKHMKSLGEYARKAYWGNYLNPVHVKKMGGIDKISKDAPAFLVEEVPGGGAYVQLTQSYDDFRTQGYKEKLIALDGYFSPIILPGRPGVQWDYNEKKKPI